MSNSIYVRERKDGGRGREGGEGGREGREGKEGGKGGRKEEKGEKLKSPHLELSISDNFLALIVDRNKPSECFSKENQPAA